MIMVMMMISFKFECLDGEILAGTVADFTEVDPVSIHSFIKRLHGASKMFSISLNP